MLDKKLYIFEKILLVVLLITSSWGFWYFEESPLLRTLVIILVLFGFFWSFVINKKYRFSTSRIEFLALIIFYIASFTLYNFLYSQNIPLYLVMILMLMLVVCLFFCVFTLDGIGEVVSKNMLRIYIVLMGLVTLEIFLTLHFWPISPEQKTLFLVVIFYLITNLIYLSIHDMLRLKKIVGFAVSGLIIIGFILLNIWLKLPK